MSTEQIKSNPPNPPDEEMLKEENSNEEITFATLMETSGDECESWYYFLRWEGNEEVLKHLSSQLEQIEMYIEDQLSTFDLDIQHLVSDRTASEMTSLELNSVTFHRKFKGKMTAINIGLRRADSNERRLSRVNQKLGLQKIADYILDEEIHPDNILSDGSEEDDESDHENGEFLVEPLEMSS